MVYIFTMIEIIKTETFERWLSRLKDRMAMHRINARIGRLSLGLFGDAKILRDGVEELRVDCGPGYRVYYTRKGPVIIVLLVGGDKSTQDADIKKAVELAKQWRD